MSEIDLRSQICQAVDTIVEERLKEHQGDYTVTCEIVDILDQSVGLYKVRYQNSYFDVYAFDGAIYSKGINVDVVIPNGDFSETKKISGATKLINPISRLSQLDEYDMVRQTSANVLEGETDRVLGNSVDRYEETIYSEKEYNIPINYALQDEDYFVLEADITPNDIRDLEGKFDFGFEIELDVFKNYNFSDVFNEDFDIAEYDQEEYNAVFGYTDAELAAMAADPETKPLYDEIMAKKAKMLRTYFYETKKYVLSIEDTKDNPFLWRGTKTVKKIFDISAEATYKLKSVKVFLTKNLDINQAYSIIFSNFKLYTAEKYNEELFNNYLLRINSNQYKYYNGDKTDNLELSLEFLIKGLDINFSLSSTPYEIYWFQEDASVGLGSEYYSSYGGIGWKCLNTRSDTGDASFVWNNAAPALTIPIKELGIKERFKVVLLYGDEDRKIYERAFYSFENINYRNDKGYCTYGLFCYNSTNFIEDNKVNTFVTLMTDDKLEFQDSFYLKVRKADESVIYNIYWTKSDSAGMYSSIENNIQSDNLYITTKDVNEYAYFVCTIKDSLNRTVLTDNIRIGNACSMDSYIVMKTDLSNKMDKYNPVGSGSFNFNASDEYDLGIEAIAMGYKGLIQDKNTFTSQINLIETNQITINLIDKDLYLKDNFYEKCTSLEYQYTEVWTSSLLLGKIYYNPLLSTENSMVFNNPNHIVFSLNTYYNFINYVFSAPAAVGLGSVAFNSSKANGFGSAAFGFLNETNGDFSFISGYDNKACGDYSFVSGYNNKINEGGLATHIEGYNNRLNSYNIYDNQGVHIEGAYNTIEEFCEKAHAEGEHNIIEESNYAAHIEGRYNKILNGSWAAHIEGSGNIAGEDCAHAEGNNTAAYGSDGAHSEGYSTSAAGHGSHSQNRYTIAFGDDSTASGYQTHAIGNWSNSKGETTVAIGLGSCVGGHDSISFGECSNAEGNSVISIGADSHVEGSGNLNIETDLSCPSYRLIVKEISDNPSYILTIPEDNFPPDTQKLSFSNLINHFLYSDIKNIMKYSGVKKDNYYKITPATFTDNIFSNLNIDDTITVCVLNDVTILNDNILGAAYGSCSHVEGSRCQTKGYTSHAEGYESQAIGDYSHSEGNTTQASGDYSHSEGYHTLANWASHAEGYESQATGSTSHAEGYQCIASGIDSHAECYHTESRGDDSHSEGNYTLAAGYESHAEGGYTKAYGGASHAEGEYTYALNSCSHAEGCGSYSLETITPISTLTVDSFVTDWQGERIGVQFTYDTLDPYFKYNNFIQIRAGWNTKIYRITTVDTDNSIIQTELLECEIGDVYTTSDYTIGRVQGGALGYCSHSEGYYTVAASDYQHVQGKYNEIDDNDVYADIVGGGDWNARKNIQTLTWEGELWNAGDVIGQEDDNGTIITHKLSEKANAATTLAGYGITDASISNGVITLGSHTIIPMTAETLWTNSDLTIAFAGSSITLNEAIENYDYYEITMMSDINSDNCISSGLIPTDKLTTLTSFGTTGYGIRGITALQTTSLTFDDASDVNFNTGATTDNSLMIPERVIGFKA